MAFLGAGVMTFKPRFSSGKQIGFLCVTKSRSKITLDLFYTKGVTSTFEGWVAHFWIILIIQSSEGSNVYLHHLKPQQRKGPPFVASEGCPSTYPSAWLYVFIAIAFVCLLSEFNNSSKSREHTCIYSFGWPRFSKMPDV